MKPNITLTYGTIIAMLLISHVAAFCRNRPDGFFVADPEDRRRFYWCDGGEAHAGKCQEGLIFFEDEQVCNTNQDPCANKPDDFFVADPADRRKFFWCYAGKGTPGKCPDDLIFFQDKQICNTEITTVRPGPPPVPTNAPPTNGPCKNAKDGTFVADPTDRRRFYWCSGGSAFPNTCPDGMYFFEYGQYCDNDVATTTRPIPTRPPPSVTTARPVPTARPPPGTTTRSAGPPIPTRATTGGVPVRTTTRAGGPPIPVRTTTTLGRPIPTRQPQGK